MKCRTMVVIFFTVVCFSLIGCKQQDSTQEEANLRVDSEQTRTESTIEYSENESVAVEMSEDADMAASQGAQVEDRKIIYSSYLTLEVSDYEEAEKRLINEVNQLGGYVVQSFFNEYDDIVNGQLTVRIPTTELHDYIYLIEDSDYHLKEKEMNGQDVTEEYVDLEARLRSKKVVEERLYQFLESAEETEQLLKISKDLERVQQEIEQIEGRVIFLNNRTDYAEVTIQLIEKKIIVDHIQGNEDLNTVEKAKKLFIETINFLLSLASGLIVMIVGLSPVLVLLAIILTLVFLYLRKKKRNNKISKE
ncbi:hypothetical protein AJ85_18370 [Alkalihalobacillus alcalophilus ATCC 27647 = CGMCC 1.3604]|uniref:DUF4349 domain-containing protein n=2 Tax=Alkalihalobacillus alcalophilus TaxID=1445 RepID=A0A4S4JX83_ALKAL|nr:hypothetical protein AJ85_18370 [Alkalihalobacillus alcalophilus ATCC 27647 = CGMCC 1.3604]